MNDASEVLGVIFECLDRSFTYCSSVSDDKSEESNSRGSRDCKSSIVHSLFGMDIFERMNCYNCGTESRHSNYTSFFHNINANALRTMKVCLIGIRDFLHWPLSKVNDESQSFFQINFTLLILFPHIYQVMSAESSFDELLNLVEMNHQLACDPVSGGCGKLNHIHHFLSTAPHVFTTGNSWQLRSKHPFLSELIAHIYI